jgi:NAD(P)-dependent dehydrogenase (short-subunit alcohol dehydrogenase family)
VVIADKNLAAAEAAAKEIGGKSLAVKVDTAVAAEVKAMIEVAAARHGRIDVLFNT